MCVCVCVFVPKIFCFLFVRTYACASVMYNAITCHSTDDLSQLIKSCEEKGIHFVYAIAPGLDIVFSKERDLEALKKKLDQVCHTFVTWLSCDHHKFLTG